MPVNGKCKLGLVFRVFYPLEAFFLGRELPPVLFRIELALVEQRFASLRTQAGVWAVSDRGKGRAVAGSPCPTRTVRRRCVPLTSGYKGSSLVGEHGLSARKG